MTHQPDHTDSQGLFFTILIGAVITLSLAIASVALYRSAMQDYKKERWNSTHQDIQQFKAQQSAARGDIDKAMNDVVKEQSSS